jgi:hypothetical protein
MQLLGSIALRKTGKKMAVIAILEARWRIPSADIATFESVVQGFGMFQYS